MFLKETMIGASNADITSRDADTGQAWTGVTWHGTGSDVYHAVVATGSGAIRPRDRSAVSLVRSAYAPPSADYEVRFKLRVASLMGAATVLVRMTPDPRSEDASYYQVQADATTETAVSWEPNKTVAGVNTSLGTAVVTSYAAGEEHDCTLSVSGSSTVTLTLTVDGSVVGTWTDSSSPITAAGSVGVQFYHEVTPADGIGVQVALIESPAEATGFTLTGVPGSVNVGSAITGTVTPDGPVGQAETVAVADDLSNTLGTLNFALGDTAGQPFSFTATSGQLGARTVTATPSPTLGTPPTASTTITNTAATAYTLTAPGTASGFVGNASGNFTLQANGVPATALVVTPSDGSGGTFTPSTITIADGAAHTFTYTPSTVGSKTVAVTHTGGSGISGDPSSVAYTSNARTLSASPSSLATSSTTTVSFTGGGTRWLTSPPTITASGGVTLGSFTATGDTAGHAPVTTTSTAGSFTYTDSTDSATAAGSVSTLLAYSSSFDFGAGYAGALASAGYTLISRATQAAIGSRTTSGVAISATDGTVSSVTVLADPTVPFDVRWDSGGDAPVYGTDPYPIPPYATAPTGVEIADAILLRDWTEIDSDVPGRCALQALRFLRNAWATTSNSLVVKAEDDATNAWTKPLTTDAEALPITGTGVG